MDHSPLTLKTLLGDYPNTQALKSGQVHSPNLAFEFVHAPVANRLFKRVVRDLEFDLAELALVTAFQAIAFHKPFTMLPAVVGAGRYQHHCLVYNRERGKLGVSQLQGKRIGIRAHAQTTVTWVRGILMNEYGVDLRGIRWITFEDGHLAEFPDPKGFVRAKPEQNMVQMLLTGELDAAIIGTDLPDDPRLESVIPDPHAAAQAWGERHQLVPINHMMMIKNSIAQKHPEQVKEVYQLLKQSKDVADSKKREKLSTDALFHAPAQDLTPFGVEANRASLELLLTYSTQQGLIPKAYSMNELFGELPRGHWAL
jgi:4,5-dihydroxyphthalate decarboxylase